jgi:hypothetical protein
MYGPKTTTKNPTKTQNTKWYESLVSFDSIKLRNEASNALLGKIKENRMESISKDTQ